jgi:hydroxymethylpyrimidine pyrophosphatase-like HAD family hydrolase
MAPVLRLIATDLDGTIVGNSDHPALLREFGRLITHLRAKHKAVWVVCTGRSLRSFTRVIEPLQHIQVMPDFVIVRHAYIYERTRLGYRPHRIWNFLIRFHLFMGGLHIRSAIREWHTLVAGMTYRVTTIHQKSNRLCMRFDNDEDTENAYALLEARAREFRYLRVFRYLREIDVRMVPFTKGLALHDLAEHLKIPEDEILAIGNGHNDISMLDGRCATHTGCPGSAEKAVMEVVHKAGGHIAREHLLAGTIDVLMAYTAGDIDSSLPEWWSPTSETVNPLTKGWQSRPPHHRHHRNRPQRRSIALGAAIAGAVIVVFASFNLIPFVSPWIMLPFTLLAKVIQYVVDAVFQ